jgi:hypothetical protein
MRWPWQNAQRLSLGGRSAPGPKEPGTTMEILREVFGAQPVEVEEMIQMRLEESRPAEREERRRPATFCLGE